MRGTFRLDYQAGKIEDHLQATMAWLCAAQDATAGGGVSAFYDVQLGEWCPAYPETTGYIIPTFYDYAAYSQKAVYGERALRMAEWLLPLQLESGAFPIGPLWPGWERTPIVFDTGQIIFGLVRTYQETGQTKFLDAAKRAGDWLAEIQDEDGCWRKHTSLGHVHTYNTRVAWAVLLLAEVTGEGRYRETAVKNLTWALSQQTADGWFHHMEFRPEEAPLTHTIAYTIRGILESGLILNDQTMIAAARHAADALRERQAQDGYLRARYGAGWQSDTDWCCLTGNAQTAVIWFKLYELTRDHDYLQAALAANHYVKRRHSRHAKHPGVRGGVAGSAPIYEGYEPYRHLNWAAKFFVDSLLLEQRLAVPALVNP
jgi:uncharacterized protein YyaL (SSP411 family)